MRRLAISLLLAVPLHAQGSLFDAENHAEVYQLGASVAAAGDVNADGYADLIMGAPDTWKGGVQVGSAYVVSGKSGVATLKFYGHLSKDRFGKSVAGLGDVDGDGRPDLAIGAPQKDQGPRYVEVRSGADGHLVHHLDEAPGSVGEFGISVSAAGDTDGDGWPDILVGAGRTSQPGYVRVFSGATGALLLHIDGVPTPPFESSGFGLSVSGLGDVDGDGHADFVVGAPRDAAVFGWQTGSAFVYSGADGHELHQFHGPHSSCEFGNSVAGPGDVDGDGVGDVLLGAWLEAANGAEAGAVHVASGVDGVELLAIPGESQYDHFAQSVAGAGDIDGDGLADLLASAEYSTSTPEGLTGSVYVLAGADGSLLAELQGGATYETAWHATIAVAGVGDFNRNGHPDVAVGLPEQFPDPFLASEVHVFELGCGPITNYGSGSATAPGPVPSLVVGGCAAPAAALTVGVTGVAGMANVVVLVGLSPADIPLPGGCTLLVTPVLALLPLPSPGASLQAKLPLHTLGISFVLQGVGVGAAGALAATQGVQVVID